MSAKHDPEHEAMMASEEAEDGLLAWLPTNDGSSVFGVDRSQRSVRWTRMNENKSLWRRAKIWLRVRWALMWMP